MKHFILLSAVLSFSLFAADPVLAEALAATGATYAARGDTERAKDALYRALANDESCATAMFELAKIADKEGNKTTASDLFTKSYGRLKDSARQAYCESRLKVLNPYAVRLHAALDEYANGLQRVEKNHIGEAVVVDEIAWRKELIVKGTQKSKEVKSLAPFNPVGKWTPEKNHIKTPTIGRGPLNVWW